VVFDKENHTYFLVNGNKMVPGVTAILGELNKPYLMPWAAKEVYNYMVAHEESVSKCLKENDIAGYKAICLTAKTAYLRKSKQAADSGTVAHDYIEKYINAKIEGKLVKTVPKPKDEVAVACIRAFFAWEKANKVNWLASEVVVGSKVHEFGGKLDAVAEIDGEVFLIDFKTSKQISKDYFLQTAAYALALEEMGVVVDGRIILRIDKEGKGFEEMVVPTPMDFDQKSFLHIREYSRWNSYVSSHVLKDGKIEGQTKGESTKPKVEENKEKSTNEIDA